MAVSFLAAALIPLVLYVWLFTIPLCRAFRDGIKAAADPNARVAPRSPWFFFDRVIRWRLRRWKKIWIYLALGYPIVTFTVLAVIGATYTPIDIWSSMIFAVAIPWRVLGFAAITTLMCVFWAPRCEQQWTLVLLVIFSAVVVYAILSLMTVNTTIIAVLLTIIAWWRARRLDERWFRISE